MKMRRARLASRFAGLAGAVALTVVAAMLAVSREHASAAPARGKIFVLMVWDGLRPDLVDQAHTPNLVALENAGVRFSRHHSIYPTLTMVDAAGLATGATPSGSGIFGDMMYLAPLLDMSRAAAIPEVGSLLDNPLNLEHSQFLAALNDPRALNGHLVRLRTTAKQVMAAGGYVAVLGKQGPTFIFDDDFARAELRNKSPQDFMFVADDMASPDALAPEFARIPRMGRNDYVSVAERDGWFTRLVTDRALLSAKAASERSKPALVVLWQHNPDLTQHVAGLGTQPALDALRAADNNLASLRAAIARLGLSDRTDLVVVSDHGFATIKATVPLARLLVAAGLKRSIFSTEIVVGADGGSDDIYVSRRDFPDAAARRQVLRRIVEFVAAQEWAGPIFSGDADSVKDTRRTGGFIGTIDGTFDESAFGLGNSPRAPDLIISFRELSDADNRALTGPDRAAYTIGPNGPEPIANHSAALVRPIPGVIYADAVNFTTGMGMHGAAGARELHNFGAAIGPDFRRGLIDDAPTGNADIAPTAAMILGQPQIPGITGRVLSEALAGGHRTVPPHSQPVIARTELRLANSRIVTTLKLTRYAGRVYLDDANVTASPLH